MAHKAVTVALVLRLCSPAAAINLRQPGLGAAATTAIPVQAVQAVATTATTTKVPVPWPHSLSLTTPQPNPVRQYKLPAESRVEWYLKHRADRDRLIAPTEAQAKVLEDALNEDPAAEFEDPSVFWSSVCNGTDESKFEPDPFPLTDWRVANGTECEAGDYYGEELYTSELEAFQNCDAMCGAIMDVGCIRTRFRLCKVGARHSEDGHQGSCLRLRVPDHEPPRGHSRPKFGEEFWKQFCDNEAAVGSRFRVLFADRLCSQGKVLDGGGGDSLPRAPFECAELAKADAACSEIFDMQEGENPVCRCLEKNTQCGAPVPTGNETIDLYRNVFMYDIAEATTTTTVAR